MPKSNATNLSPEQLRVTESKRYFNSSFETDNLGLRAYFGNVVKGQSRNYTVATFAKGIPTSTLLDSWKSILKSIEDRWPSLYEYEIDLANKVGPMSIELPLEERMDDIDAYYDGVLLPSKPLSDEAVAAFMREWSRLGGLRVRSQAHTLEVMRKSTNSGSPYFTKRRHVVNKTVPCNVYCDLERGIVTQELPGGDYTAAAVLGWRGQEGGPSEQDVKQRVVWMFPFAVNLQELRVYQPLIEGAQKSRLVPAWVSMDEVDRRITDMFDTKSSDDLVICTDFSKFDQHFNFQLSSTVSSLLRKLFKGDAECESWLDSIFPIKYMIPLAYNWEKVRFGVHGMGSGSGGTNADETLAHRVLQYEAAILAGAKLNLNSQCLGDDGVLTYPGITVDDVVTAYTSHGLEMNPDKQYASKDDCTYLRRWHHKDYRINGICAGVYSTMRALGRLRYLERRPDAATWTDEAIVLRELSILENCKYHPLREEFLDYVISRDKLKLGLAVPHFYSDLKRTAMKLLAEMPDFLGYVRANMSESTGPAYGIESWWVVQAMKDRAKSRNR
nr:RNA-dependent RNA polymerase [Mute swan feces associated picobirnavirus 2]